MLYTLYKWLPAWGLPSLDPGSVQVEAYLRMSGVELAVEDCSIARTSPSGVMPALEHGSTMLEGPANGDSFARARAIIAHLKANGEDIDTWLPTVMQGELLAFTSLCQTRLEPASLYTTWCEPESYSNHTRPAYAAGLPFPLSWFLPWSQQRTIASRFIKVSREEVYADAAEVFKALAAHMRANSERQPYFFGAQPTSLDALLFGHLGYFRTAPVAAPELRESLKKYPILIEYVDRIASAFFSTPLPAPPPYSSRTWADRAGDAASAPRDRPTRPATKEDPLKEALNFRGKIWLGCAAACVAAYILFSGDYFSIGFMDEGEEDAGDVFDLEE